MVVILVANGCDFSVKWQQSAHDDFAGVISMLLSLRVPEVDCLLASAVDSEGQNVTLIAMILCDQPIKK